MKSHEIDYQLHGDDMQMVEITLDPQETVIAEAGAMNWMDEQIEFEAKMGDGSDPNKGLFGKLLDVGKRALTGESIFMTHFTNQGRDRQNIAFAAPYPGKIIPVDLANVGGTILCQKDAFLCAALGTKVDIAFTQKLGSGFFGGEGFILQRLSGDGMAFVHAGGTIIEKHLKPGERLRVDTGCLVGLQDQVDYDIKFIGGFKNALFGGEGLFLAELTGPGLVFLQSLPFSRLADRIVAAAKSGNRGESKGAAGVGGDLLGGILGGDKNF